jgi:hypothetical protein
MARLLERRRAEIEEASKSEADAVALVRSRLEAQLHERDVELQRALADTVAAASLRERAQRESKAANTQLQRVTELAENERRRLQRTIDDQVTRLDALNRALGDATCVAREAAIQTSVESSAAELARRAAEDSSSEAAATIRRLQQTCTDLDARLAAARDVESATRRKLGEVTRAAADAQGRATAALDDAAACRDRDRRFADKRIAALQDEISRATEHCAHLTVALDASGRAAVADSRTGLVRLEADLAGSAEELAGWQNRAQELAEALDGLQVKRTR